MKKNADRRWMQLECARRERERARTALREIREGIANEEEHGLWDADAILAIIDRALSPENPAQVYQCAKCGVSAKWSSADCPICFGDLIPMLNPTDQG